MISDSIYRRFDAEREVEGGLGWGPGPRKVQSLSCWDSQSGADSTSSKDRAGKARVSVPISVIWILSLGTGPRSFSFTNFGSFDCVRLVKVL
jgi:hypothetical protein